MKCERCGKEVSANAGFCPYCGYKVEATEEEKTREDEIKAGKRCSKCGALITDGVKFCAECGTKVGESGTPVVKKKVVYVRTCKNCGTKVPINEYYCPNCHTTMGTQTATRPTSSYGEDKSRLGFWTGFFFGLIALIVGVCMYPSGSTERTTFVSGWLKSLIVGFVIGLVLVLIISCGVCATIQGV